MSTVIPAQKLDQMLHDPDAQRIEEDLYRSLESELATLRPPQTDPLWVSALRGRIMAAIASAASLVTSGAMLYQSVTDFSRGPDVGAVAGVALQAGQVADAGLALVVAASSLIALLASLNSKAREWLRTRMAPYV